eukprot:TRINITY_DN91557_c0_g1_i1.p1 TRINITY_DN91557_c0_g1~~TRINITY_DN91557_c0_g1_i1.p1  ORF type:complete len:370 (+),score=72.10 TRINITY_DN91557_c0_g1_i1:3-1112(+)
MIGRRLYRLVPLSSLVRFALPTAPMSSYYRHDGVRITHDPYAPGMAEKYGAPGGTDNEGFDPYADSVGAGIYGGRVKRDEHGMVVIGKQYQNHNPRPGPVYAGGGYTPINEALKDASRLEELLGKFPDLANDVSTGGAMPLHMCGMSRTNQLATARLIRHGADIEALDTYGFTPLHRMASNNLAVGAQALLDAGADPEFKGGCGQSPMAVAKSSEARDVIRVLQNFPRRKAVPVSKVTVMNAGVQAVNGEYEARDGNAIPDKFALVCEQNNWNTLEMWRKLAGAGRGGEKVTWYEAPNKSYIYFNVADQHWWIDGPDGLGVYKALGSPLAVPAYPRGSGGKAGWFPLAEENLPVPSLLIHRDTDAKQEL